MKLINLTFIVLAINLKFATANSFEKESVTLFLKWKHQFQFAGYYMAKEKKYFEEEGLDVEIIQRDVKWTPLEKVINMKDSYGITDSSIVKSYLENQPVVIVSSIFQSSPLVLAVREEDQIKGPLDLAGKKVMYQKGVDDAVFKIMFQNAGIDESKVIHIPHTMNNDDLINKKVDAISIYSTNQPYYYKNKNFKINIIDPTNYGVDLYGDTLFTSQEEAVNHSERVRRFKRASIKGWYYALSNIEETSKLIIEKYNPAADLKKLIFEGHETKKIIRPDIINIGYTNLERLQKVASYYSLSEKYNKTNIYELDFEHYVQNYTNEKNKYIKQIIFIFFIIVGLTGFLLYSNKI